MRHPRNKAPEISGVGGLGDSFGSSLNGIHRKGCGLLKYVGSSQN